MGKTWLMGTASDVPKMNDVLMLSAESGDMTLSNDPDHNFDAIDYVRVKDYKTAARVYDFLALHCKFRDATDAESIAKLQRLQDKFLGENDEEGLSPQEVKFNSRLRRYRTVIIDSLTEVEQYCMMQLLGVNDAVKLDDEVAGAEWAEYKKQHMMVQRLIRSYRDLPMHSLYTCARAYREDELKRSLYSPAMTGKLSNQVQGFMDMVGYLVMGAQSEDPDTPPSRRMYITPGARWAAKSRFSAYKRPYFDNPTIPGILHAVGLFGDGDVEKRFYLKTPQAKAK